jgi:hypothetical protein
MYRAILAAVIAGMTAVMLLQAGMLGVTVAAQPAPAPRGASQGESPIPAPQTTQCQNFVATNAQGVVQHYEDCTPADGLVKRCEVIDATDARGKVRKIQNCARVTPESTGVPR